MNAEEDLISRLQTVREKECGHVVTVESSGDEDADLGVMAGDGMDDVVERMMSTEQEKAREEFKIYCNVVKNSKHFPRAFKGETMKLGKWIEIGAVDVPGSNIKASPPFVTCNLASHIDKNGHFDLVGFLKPNKATFPFIFKLALCLASLRTNEVGCERFFSTAGYVSSPRRTSLKVRNYECIATLRMNMQQVYIDEAWVVQQYLIFEKDNLWAKLDEREDLLVLNLERELQAEDLGIDLETLPPLNFEEIDD